MASLSDPVKYLDVLSQLLWSGTETEAQGSADIVPHAKRKDGTAGVFALRQDEIDHLLALAKTHHVAVRSLQVFRQMMAAAGSYGSAEWAATAIENERARIDKALSFLAHICETLQAEGCNVTVIKSLDHWPDLGSDLDLFTDAQPADVIHIMAERFKARLAPRSWGDRLAKKWNFSLPGLRELVEVHFGCLGQTGEHVEIAESLTRRAQTAHVESYSFRVPVAEDRLIVTTLQRMYRHFCLRLCDIANTAHLVETELINYSDLHSRAQAMGIWEGVATYLGLVSDYVKSYRGRDLEAFSATKPTPVPPSCAQDGLKPERQTEVPRARNLAIPCLVRSAARFGGDRLTFREGFLRIPIMPHSVFLYTGELTRLALKGELQSTFRLSLLPCLAVIAVIEHRIRGTGKGIW